ncbi:growth-regulating factor 5 [Lactuca sativa]|uniref:Growth-regulating factor n=1 Tax=Lactuca sativa TaxID=4236 RepID=A0A9R1WWB5_LACSA|nr:growth-regulating factor 5 [Lactuca sativa]KAJ0190041.1 hypothetical protein LSAT_V11C800423310 [Lactuca sativa]
METMTTARNDNSRFPFTSSQWQELEHQALVYKYMISGMPIPPDLLFSIQRSLDSSTRLLLHHHSPHHSIGVGWNCFQMGFGRKIDPEPGRCRRTDGKKWRCSKEAYPDSKYCERHMHRGRNRSRKPVEVNSAPNTPPALSISTKPMMNYPVSPFLYPQIQLSSSSSSRAPVNGNVVSSHQDRFWLESSSGYSSRSEKDNSYGMKEEMAEHPFLSERCGSGTMSASMGGDSWNLEPLAMNNNNTSSSSSSSSSLMVHTKQRAYYDYDQLTLKINQRKDEQPKKVMHHFFDESPQNDDVDGGNKDSSTTQLSISIPNGARDFFQTHNHK